MPASVYGGGPTCSMLQRNLHRHCPSSMLRDTVPHEADADTIASGQPVAMSVQIMMRRAVVDPVYALLRCDHSRSDIVVV